MRWGQFLSWKYDIEFRIKRDIGLDLGKPPIGEED